MNRAERRLLKFRPGLAADRAVSIPVHRQSLVRAMQTKMRMRGLEFDVRHEDPDDDRDGYFAALRGVSR